MKKNVRVKTEKAIAIHPFSREPQRVNVIGEGELWIFDKCNCGELIRAPFGDVIDDVFLSVADHDCHRVYPCLEKALQLIVKNR